MQITTWSLGVRSTVKHLVFEYNTETAESPNLYSLIQVVYSQITKCTPQILSKDRSFVLSHQLKEHKYKPILMIL